MVGFRYRILFPGGRKKALTLSYDDGMIYDRQLVDMFDRYRLKATFHLSSGKLGESGEDEYVREDEIEELYEGHEISGHFVNHAHGTQLNRGRLLNEVLEDRRKLEELSGSIVRGMSYPYGEFSDDIVNVIRAAGIEYSRTVNSTGSFSLPGDFLRWNPTCHHNNAKQYIDRFLNPFGYEDMMLFYIWGHSFELNREGTWSMMEDMCRRLAGHEDVWYATNIEVKDYVSAIRSLITDVDDSRIYNPSGTEIWIEADGSVRTVGALETIRI